MWLIGNLGRYNMSFWNSDKDDEIWNELKYWIENPVTEEENKMYEKEINNYVNLRIAQMFQD